MLSNVGELHNFLDTCRIGWMSGTNSPSGKGANGISTLCFMIAQIGESILNTRHFVNVWLVVFGGFVKADWDSGRHLLLFFA